LTFTASNDGDGTGMPNSDVLVLTIQVQDANATPEVTAISNQVVAVGASLDIPITAADADAGPLALSVENLPAFATLIDNGDGTGIIRVAPVAGNRGNTTITVRATDNGNGVPAAALSGTAQFILSVTAPNEPPVMVATGDKVAVIGEALIFNIQVADPDEDPLTWAADNLPVGAAFAGTTVYGVARFTWTPTADDAGSHTITLRVTDSGNNGE